MIKNIYLISKNFLLDLVFPRYCIGCGTEEDWICSKCLKTIDIIKEPFCPECRRKTEVGEFCDICRDKSRLVPTPALDGILICANFDEGVLKEAIHQFKYGFVFDIGSVLGRIMAGKLRSVGGIEGLRYDQRDYPQVGPRDPFEFDLIIPVPLHKKRKAWRGFNQAEILGRELSRIKTNYHELGKIKFNNKILVRKKYTIPQMELDREGRLNNLKDVFIVGEALCGLPNAGDHAGSPLREKNILLVDDITTTGATLEECAKVLKQNGAKTVWGIVLAKGK